MSKLKLALTQKLEIEFRKEDDSVLTNADTPDTLNMFYQIYYLIDTYHDKTRFTNNKVDTLAYPAFGSPQITLAPADSINDNCISWVWNTFNDRQDKINSVSMNKNFFKDLQNGTTDVLTDVTIVGNIEQTTNSVSKPFATIQEMFKQYNIEIETDPVNTPNTPDKVFKKCFDDGPYALYRYSLLPIYDAKTIFPYNKTHMGYYIDSASSSNKLKNTPNICHDSNFTGKKYKLDNLYNPITDHSMMMSEKAYSFLAVGDLLFLHKMNVENPALNINGVILSNMFHADIDTDANLFRALLEKPKAVTHPALGAITNEQLCLQLLKCSITSINIFWQTLLSYIYMYLKISIHVKPDNSTHFTGPDVYKKWCHLKEIEAKQAIWILRHWVFTHVDITGSNPTINDGKTIFSGRFQNDLTAYSIQHWYMTNQEPIAPANVIDGTAFSGLGDLTSSKYEFVVSQAKVIDIVDVGLKTLALVTPYPGQPIDLLNHNITTKATRGSDDPANNQDSPVVRHMVDLFKPLIQTGKVHNRVIITIGEIMKFSGDMSQKLSCLVCNKIFSEIDVNFKAYVTCEDRILVAGCIADEIPVIFGLTKKFSDFLNATKKPNTQTLGFYLPGKKNIYGIFNTYHLKFGKYIKVIKTCMESFSNKMCLDHYIQNKLDNAIFALLNCIKQICIMYKYLFFDTTANHTDVWNINVRFYEYPFDTSKLPIYENILDDTPENSILNKIIDYFCHLVNFQGNKFTDAAELFCSIFTTPITGPGGVIPIDNVFKESMSFRLLSLFVYVINEQIDCFKYFKIRGLFNFIKPYALDDSNENWNSDFPTLEAALHLSNNNLDKSLSYNKLDEFDQKLRLIVTGPTTIQNNKYYLYSHIVIYYNKITDYLNANYTIDTKIKVFSFTHTDTGANPIAITEANIISYDSNYDNGIHDVFTNRINVNLPGVDPTTGVVSVLGTIARDSFEDINEKIKKNICINIGALNYENKNKTNSWEGYFKGKLCSELIFNMGNLNTGNLKVNGIADAQINLYRSAIKRYITVYTGFEILCKYYKTLDEYRKISNIIPKPINTHYDTDIQQIDFNRMTYNFLEDIIKFKNKYKIFLIEKHTQLVIMNSAVLPSTTTDADIIATASLAAIAIEPTAHTESFNKINEAIVLCNTILNTVGIGPPAGAPLPNYAALTQIINLSATRSIIDIAFYILDLKVIADNPMCTGPGNLIFVNNAEYTAFEQENKISTTGTTNTQLLDLLTNYDDPAHDSEQENIINFAIKFTESIMKFYEFAQLNLNRQDTDFLLHMSIAKNQNTKYNLLKNKYDKPTQIICLIDQLNANKPPLINNYAHTHFDTLTNINLDYFNNYEIIIDNIVDYIYMSPAEPAPPNDPVSGNPTPIFNFNGIDFIHNIAGSDNYNNFIGQPVGNLGLPQGKMHGFIVGVLTQMVVTNPVLINTVSTSASEKNARILLKSHVKMCLYGLIRIAMSTTSIKNFVDFTFDAIQRNTPQTNLTESIAFAESCHIANADILIDKTSINKSINILFNGINRDKITKIIYAILYASIYECLPENFDLYVLHTFNINQPVFRPDNYNTNNFDDINMVCKNANSIMDSINAGGPGAYTLNDGQLLELLEKIINWGTNNKVFTEITVPLKKTISNELFAHSVAKAFMYTIDTAQDQSAYIPQPGNIIPDHTNTDVNANLDNINNLYIKLKKNTMNYIKKKEVVEINNIISHFVNDIRFPMLTINNFINKKETSGESCLNIYVDLVLYDQKAFLKLNNIYNETINELNNLKICSDVDFVNTYDIPDDTDIDDIITVISSYYNSLSNIEHDGLESIATYTGIDRTKIKIEDALDIDKFSSNLFNIFVLLSSFDGDIIELDIINKYELSDGNPFMDTIDKKNLFKHLFINVNSNYRIFDVKFCKDRIAPDPPPGGIPPPPPPGGIPALEKYPDFPCKDYYKQLTKNYDDLYTIVPPNVIPILNNEETYNKPQLTLWSLPKRHAKGTPITSGSPAKRLYKIENEVLSVDYNNINNLFEINCYKNATGTKYYEKYLNINYNFTKKYINYLNDFCSDYYNFLYLGYPLKTPAQLAKYTKCIYESQKILKQTAFSYYQENVEMMKSEIIKNIGSNTGINIYGALTGAHDTTLLEQGIFINIVNAASALNENDPLVVPLTLERAANRAGAAAGASLGAYYAAANPPPANIAEIGSTMGFRTGHESALATYPNGCIPISYFDRIVAMYPWFSALENDSTMENIFGNYIVMFEQIKASPRMQTPFVYFNSISINNNNSINVTVPYNEYPLDPFVMFPSVMVGFFPVMQRLLKSGQTKKFPVCGGTKNAKSENLYNLWSEAFNVMNENIKEFTNYCTNLCKYGLHDELRKYLKQDNFLLYIYGVVSIVGIDTKMKTLRMIHDKINEYYTTPSLDVYLYDEEDVTLVGLFTSNQKVFLIDLLFSDIDVSTITPAPDYTQNIDEIKGLYYLTDEDMVKNYNEIKELIIILLDLIETFKS